uniref:Uncharacterized protein n=1 Tax=Kuetzingia canaliculata TaxID=228262 RepID=A0A1Z1MQD7_KUECA|nr:hypothetical protein [Kuetzingia canaliculata]ARW67981.1 hypothetical protein [Kuetzingia canaliculata]
MEIKVVKHSYLYKMIPNIKIKDTLNKIIFLFINIVKL